MPLKGIVFDVFGTLIDLSSVNLALEQQFGIKSAEIATWWRTKQLEYTWLLSLMGKYKPFIDITEDALRYACTRTNAPIDDTIVAALQARYLQASAYRDVHATLDILEKKHKLAVLSNGNASMLQMVLHHNKLFTRMHKVLSAEQVQVFKPSPRVYALAVEALEIPAEQLLFVSSNTWDVAGARAFGFKVAWIDRGAAPEEMLSLRPHYHLYAFSDLADLPFQ